MAKMWIVMKNPVTRDGGIRISSRPGAPLGDRNGARAVDQAHSHPALQIPSL